jgi:bifunctional non-homologous end joining protein LigD
VNHLTVRSCLIDGQVVCCDEGGLATFQLLRHRRNEPQAFIYAFDLLELNGADLRREPIEVRKATLANILRKSRPDVRLNEPLEHRCCVPARLQDGAVVSKRLGSRYRSGRSPDWLKFKNPAAPAVRREAEEDWIEQRSSPSSWTRSPSPCDGAWFGFR